MAIKILSVLLVATIATYILVPLFSREIFTLTIKSSGWLSIDAKITLFSNRLLLVDYITSYPHHIQNMEHKETASPIFSRRVRISSEDYANILDLLKEIELIENPITYEDAMSRFISSITVFSLRLNGNFFVLMDETIDESVYFIEIIFQYVNLEELSEATRRWRHLTERLLWWR